MLAERWEDFLKYPLFELNSGWEFGVCDEAVHVAFTNEPCFLGTPEAVNDGVVKRHPTAMLLDSVHSVGITEHSGYIFSAKHRSAFFVVRSADCGVFEYQLSLSRKIGKIVRSKDFFPCLCPLFPPGGFSY